MEITLPYGHSTISAVLPDGVPVDVIEPPVVEPAPDPARAVREALDHPLGGFSWARSAAASSVAIAISDRTRPVPHDLLLPPLLDRLALLGIAPAAITFHVAVGGHPPAPRATFDQVVPPGIAARYRVVSHDADRDAEQVALGRTARGTPVAVGRRFVEADLKIVVGTIEPHQFAGFSGGVKTAAIGLAGRATIRANHSLMTDPGARIATFDGNPVRQDIEEIGAMIGVDLALDAIVDDDARIVEVLAGTPIAVIEAGWPLVRRLRTVAVERRYAAAVTSPGGHPKDLDVYQSQKAIASAAAIVRPGGTIVLVAACPNGAGDPRYAEWVAERRSHADVLTAFEGEGFRLGPHKAYQIARDVAHRRLIVVSELTDADAAGLLLDTVPDLATACDAMTQILGPNDRIAVLPHATATVAHLDRRATDAP